MKKCRQIHDLNSNNYKFEDFFLNIDNCNEYWVQLNKKLADRKIEKKNKQTNC